MLEKHTSHVLDVKDHWWRKTLIDKISVAYLFCMSAQNWLSQITHSDTSWKIISASFQHIYDNNWLTSVMSVAWKKEIKQLNKKNTVTYTLFTEQSILIYDKQQAWFNNINYQCQNILETCVSLDIRSQKIQHMSEMSISLSFMSWQPVVIHAVLQMWSTELRDYTIADAVDLDKTWITADYILSVSFWIYLICQSLHQTQCSDLI